MDFHEIEPYNSTLCTRRLEGAFSSGGIVITLENKDGLKVYTLELNMISAQTPEQSLPDSRITNLACEIYSALSGGGILFKLIEKNFTLMLSDVLKSFEIAKPNLTPGYIYQKDIFFGKIFSNNISINVHQYKPKGYISTIKIINHRYK